jgi:diadenosine tetraphosphate (Ap4A) HIT family hydrolase
MGFELDPRLERDTILVSSMPMCELLVMNDARYPWAILVPRIAGARELHDLKPADGAVVWAEVMKIAQALSTWPRVGKINIGALGNMVPQLHIHIVGRHANDPAWPGPVWGHSPRVPYENDEAPEFIDFLERAARAAP